MAMLLEAAKRQFKFQNEVLEDPDPTMSPEEVMDIYANTHPSLTNATVSAPEINEECDTIIYEFLEHVGKKG